MLHCRGGVGRLGDKVRVGMSGVRKTGPVGSESGESEAVRNMAGIGMQRLVGGGAVLGVLAMLCVRPVQAGDIVREFGLKTATILNASVYYEPELESILPEFETQYVAFKKDVLSNVGVPEDKIVPVCDAIHRIIGVERDKARDSTKRVLGDFDKLIRSLSFEKPTFYLIRKNLIKDYLRQGGTLPHFTYDKQADEAGYEIRFFSTSSSEPAPFEMVFPLDPNTVSTEVTGGVFELMSFALRQMMSPVLIHEAAEVTLIYEMNSSDWYRRWFTDGFANVVVCQVLEELYSQKEAQEYAELFSAKPYADIQKQINLRYWMAMEYEFLDMNDVLETESRIKQARYNYATEEALGLIQRHGADCLKKIVDVYCAGEARDNAALYDAIEKVTGERLDKAFVKYQSFANAMEGLKTYTAQYEAARKKGDDTAALGAVLRMMELYNTPLSPLALSARDEAALLLTKMGQGELADQKMLEFAGKMMTSDDDKTSLTGMELLMVYAGQTERLEIAGMYAEAILKEAREASNAASVRTQITQLQKQRPEVVEKARQAELGSEFYVKAKQLLEARAGR